MKTIIVIVLTVILRSIRATLVEDVDLNITQLIKKHGYPVEVHGIETSDGYLLGTFRIPYSNLKSNASKKIPIILMHGFLGSAENFILSGSGRALAYILADENYDVWLANARGNWHSRKHTVLDPDRDKEFWKFSWHEIGIFDIPATIDYVLNVTKNEKLHFIGYSQGVTSFFVMCSELPQYNEKVNMMIAMAPPVFFSNLRNPIVNLISPLHRILEKIATIFQVTQLPPSIPGISLRDVKLRTCGQKNSNLILCRLYIYFIGGFGKGQIEDEFIPIIAVNIVAGASSMQGLHYLQIMKSGFFRQYDWGVAENLKRYKSSVPPSYNLKRVTVPVGLIYGNNDAYVPESGVDELVNALPNVIALYKVPYKYWSHLDFVWGRDAKKLVYTKILDVMKSRRFSQNSTIGYRTHTNLRT